MSSGDLRSIGYSIETAVLSMPQACGITLTKEQATLRAQVEQELRGRVGDTTLTKEQATARAEIEQQQGEREDETPEAKTLVCLALALIAALLALAAFIEFNPLSDDELEQMHFEQTDHLPQNR